MAMVFPGFWPGSLSGIPGLSPENATTLNLDTRCVEASYAANDTMCNRGLSF